MFVIFTSAETLNVFAIPVADITRIEKHSSESTRLSYLQNDEPYMEIITGCIGDHLRHINHILLGVT